MSVTNTSNAPAVRISRRYLLLALVATLTVVSLAYLLRPITDPDFFWHLKTGEWISEHRHLPASDPFSYTGQSIDTKGARFILTTYWITQLLYYNIYAAGGYFGIVLLRFVLTAVLFTIIWVRRKGDVVVDMALLLVFAVAFLENSPIERPQVLSFIGFGLLLCLLDRLKKAPEIRPSSLRGWRGPILVALLMMAWANVHGGIALGQATIILYLVAEGAKFTHGSLRPIKREGYRALLVAGCAGLFASLLNPNTYQALGLAFYTGTAPGSHGLLTITEYLSIPEAFKINQDYIRVVDLVLMLVVAAAIVSKPKRLDITAALLAAGTGYFAFRYARHMPVFMIVALPLAGHFLSRSALVRWARILTIAGAFALIFIFARNERHGLTRLRTGEWVNPDDYPVKAADFIIANNLRGNMYNYYTWGGYLIWRLAPERQVFVDPRGINPDVFWEGTMIDYGFELSGKPQWKSLFAKYDIAYAVIPLELRGKQVPLVGNLTRDPEWAAVFIGENSVIFAKRKLRSR